MVQKLLTACEVGVVKHNNNKDDSPTIDPSFIMICVKIKKILMIEIYKY